MQQYTDREHLPSSAIFPTGDAIASPDFLFEQMMLRERVQDFDSLTSSEASALVSDIESAYSETQNAFVAHYDRDDISGACAKWVEFHFQQKLLDELVRAQRLVAYDPCFFIFQSPTALTARPASASGVLAST